MIDSATVLVKLTFPDGSRSVMYHGLYGEFEKMLVNKYLGEVTDGGKVRYIGGDNYYIRFTPTFAINLKGLKIHYCKKHGWVFGKRFKKHFGR